MSGAHDEPIDPALFRAAMSSFPSGVTVITTATEGKPWGTTVSAFSSLSLSPPLVLACLTSSSLTLAQVCRSGSFCVNILAADQAELAMKFARSGAADRFEQVDLVSGVLGDPVLQGCAAVVECRLQDRVSAGDHDILIGRPVHLHVDAARAPLVHGRGGFSPLPL